MIKHHIIGKTVDEVLDEFHRQRFERADDGDKGAAREILGSIARALRARFDDVAGAADLRDDLLEYLVSGIESAAAGEKTPNEAFNLDATHVSKKYINEDRDLMILDCLEIIESSGIQSRKRGKYRLAAKLTGDPAIKAEDVRNVARKHGK